MLRVSVVGNSGSGKTMVAQALATELGVPYIELDAIFHQPGWRPLPAIELQARVNVATASGGWVVDGNYSAVRDLVWARADTVVWLDLPRHAVMRQVIWRTLRRVVLRAELWNGNRERWKNLFARDPDQSVIVWAWQRHSVYQARYTAATTDPAWRHLTFVRIRSRKDAQQLLDRVNPTRNRQA